MEDKLIRGSEIKKLVHEQVKSDVEDLKKKGITPGLVVVLVGEDPASAIYVRNKNKACEAVGIYSETIHMDATTSQEKLIGFISELNQDRKFNGILVQQRFPPDHSAYGRNFIFCKPFNRITFGFYLIVHPR